jgi:hypothetical protein
MMGWPIPEKDGHCEPLNFCDKKNRCGFGCGCGCGCPRSVDVGVNVDVGVDVDVDVDVDASVDVDVMQPVCEIMQSEWVLSVV